MPRGERHEPNVADAAVEIVHGAQALRRAARAEGLALARKAIGGIGRVLDALGEL